MSTFKQDDYINIIIRGERNICFVLFLHNFTLYFMWFCFALYLTMGFNRVHTTGLLQGLFITLFAFVDFVSLVAEFVKFYRNLLILERKKIRLIREDRH